MATATQSRLIGPADHGLPMSFDDFIEAGFQDGWLYELARGVIVVTDVPGIGHGRVVRRLWQTVIRYDDAHPGIINYNAGGMECRLRLPGMQSDRHPDQAIYLNPPPGGDQPWTRWAAEIVIEVVSRGGEGRDYEEKREEYLRMGALEYWIIDPALRRMLVHRRAGDTWQEVIVPAGEVYRTHLLPGLEVRPAELLGE